MENQQYSLANLPEITFAVNNQGNRDLRCLNYIYQIKSMGVQSALYRCHTKGCYASISLKTHKVGEVNEVFDPMVVTNLFIFYQLIKEAFSPIHFTLGRVKCTFK